MTPRTFILSIAFLISCTTAATSQGSSAAERRAFKEYTSPEELVSIAPTATFDRALAAISEVSQKFIGKIIIDIEHRSTPIDIDIQGVQWRDALEMICRRQGVWYTEYENYIQIIGPEGAATATSGTPPPLGIQKEYATLKSREIKISAIFFEVNLTKLDEVGVNWNFMKSNSDVAVDATFGGADRVTSDIFSTNVTPKISFANISVLAKLFSNYDLGELLSGPQLIVRSGEEGRIQVGQDFSIKERDFAGNIIDKFYSAGTIIKVTPQLVTEKGVNFIHIVVDVERSNVNPGTVSTIINKTKANTNLLLLDGEETIIGGLYNSDVSTIRSGIPVLKDLPWYVFGLRYLFGYNRDQVSKKELVILLKAELVPTLQERITQKAKEDNVFENWLEKQELEEARIKARKE